MQYLNNKNKLFDLLAEGALVLTPNNRLSGALLQEYFTSRKNKTVDKPLCLPYNTWLLNAYQQLKFLSPQIPHPIFLNNNQCQHLWRKLLKSEPGLTYSEGLLNAVIEAWEHCQQWQLATDHPGFHYTPQTLQFQQWRQHIDKQLQQLNAITQYQIAPYLLKEHLDLPKTIVWVCFDDFSPQQKMLQHHFADHDIQQYSYDLPERTESPLLFAAKDQQDELEQLILWLQLKLREGAQHIGVVIPDLEQESAALKRVLAHHFDADLYNISLGLTLNAFPIISHAMTWLHLGTNHLNTHEATLLLQSPYIGKAKTEFLPRSHYLQDSALLQEQSFPLNALIKELQDHSPKLAEILSQIPPYPKEASPLEWVRLFKHRLNTLGFPGDYGLSSENYQCYSRFNGVLDEFCQLYIISPSLSTVEALNALTHLLNNTVFQAQKTKVPIQISGLLEASGCEFDCLWVKGLNDQCLPQRPRLSAFIPPQLQRELFMPHSLPSRELLFARKTLRRLNDGSGETIFSYSEMQGDNPALPCALITDYAAFVPQPVLPNASQSSCLIPFTETYSIPPVSDESVFGGTRLLANQAKCPFKAFAEHRLYAKPTQELSDGINHMEKGTLIHKIMELLWRALGEQSALLRLTAFELDQCIEQTILQALTPLKQDREESFPPLIQDIEFTRLKRLVLACIEWEKQRPAFTVSALEESYSLNLAGLDIKVRVDRLDQVGDKKWVIDYKSSLPISKPWNEERPKEPQLLLYALLDEQINTLLLMQLKNGKVSFSGLSDEEQSTKGINTLKKNESWEESRAKWLQQLTHLAEEIQSGHCLPQPASAAMCQQCDFSNLCRYEAN